MTSINKQKFLAELGKLLTFMYEEDRQRALELYSRMFDETEDERALLQFFVSPTKQAVVVARAYNANLGRLAVHSENKLKAEDRDENGVPDYVQAIETVREAAFAAQALIPRMAENAEEEEEPEAPVDENQMTLFEGEEETTPAPETQKGEEPDADAPAAESAEESGAEETAEEPQAAVAAESEEIVYEEEPPLFRGSAPKIKGIDKDKVAYFTMPGEEQLEARSVQENEIAADGFNIDTAGMKKTRRKPKIFLLILYILVAIPVTLGIIVVLLVPALLFLGLSVVSIICGIVVINATFTGLHMFADILVVLGLALVLFALGLLSLWTSIWFVGGVIVSVVHGVALLCDRWCYEEVLEG